MTTLIVDANNLTMRGIHAMQRAGLSVDGVPTGPLLVVINALSRHVKEEQPDRVVMCWDSGQSLYRLGLYPEYKGNRQPSSIDDTKQGTFDLVKAFCALAGIPMSERPGYEADDLIAAYVARYRAEDRVVIASSDKDFLQLLGPSVEQIRFTTGSSETERWDTVRVEAEYGCRPTQLLRAMALAGDTSDNIPGVPRVGLKTAIKILERNDWDWAETMTDPKVVEHEEIAQISYALIDLTTPHRELNLPALPSWRPTHAASLTYSSLEAFLVKYQMQSVLKRLYAGTLWGSGRD